MSYMKNMSYKTLWSLAMCTTQLHQLQDTMESGHVYYLATLATRHYGVWPCVLPSYISYKTLWSLAMCTSYISYKTLWSLAMCTTQLHQLQDTMVLAMCTTQLHQLQDTMESGHVYYLATLATRHYGVWPCVLPSYISYKTLWSLAMCTTQLHQLQDTMESGHVYQLHQLQDTMESGHVYYLATLATRHYGVWPCVLPSYISYKTLWFWPCVLPSYISYKTLWSLAMCTTQLHQLQDTMESGHVYQLHQLQDTMESGHVYYLATLATRHYGVWPCVLPSYISYKTLWSLAMCTSYISYKTLWSLAMCTTQLHQLQDTMESGHVYYLATLATRHYGVWPCVLPSYIS